MRLRWAIWVVIVLALVAGADYGWRHAKQRLDRALRRGLQRIEVANLPQHPVSTVTTGLGPPGGRLTIENRYGDVMVLGGAPEPSLQTQVFAAGATPQEARRRGNPFRIKTRTGAHGETGIWVEAPADDPDLPYMTIKLTLRVPGATRVAVAASAGRVEVHGLTGPVSVRNQSGEVIVANCTGPVTTGNLSGQTMVSGAERGLVAESGSGSVDLKAISGPLVARLGSGGLTVRARHTSSIAASTLSGSIGVHVAAPFSGHMEVRSLSGEVEVALPAGSDCRVQAATRTGSVTCALALRDGRRSQSQVSGRLGAGKGQVTISTASGSIVLQAAQ
jgi:hypothetical protein